MPGVAIRGSTTAALVNVTADTTDWIPPLAGSPPGRLRGVGYDDEAFFASLAAENFSILY